MSTKVFGQDLGSIKRRVIEALAFWGESMRSSLPRSIQQKLTVDEEQIIVSLHQETDTLNVIQNRDGRVTALGEFLYKDNYCDPEMLRLLTDKANKDSELILAVSPQQVLSKRVAFPEAVAGNLKQTLYYEMDKHTPFPKNEVLYDVEVVNKNAGKVFAMLHILHRPTLAHLLKLFTDNQVMFDQLCTTETQNINLLPESLRRKQPLFRFGRNGFLLVLVSALLLLMLATPLYFKRQTSIDLDREIARLDPLANGEIALWEQRDKAEQTLVEFLDLQPLSFSQIYEELAKVIPDDTWVNSFNLQRDKVILRGESTDAAALVAIINKSPLFNNAKIVSPIVKARGNNAKERFHISLGFVTKVGEH